jgi:HK97 family phage major capsid protein
MTAEEAKQMKEVISGVSDQVKAFQDTNQKLHGLLEKQREEIKATRETSEETKDAIAQATKTYDAQLADLRGNSDEFIKKFEASYDELKKQIDEFELKLKKGGVGLSLVNGQGRDFKSIAQDDERFWGWKANGSAASPQLRVGSFWGGKATNVLGHADVENVISTARPQSIFSLPVLRSEHLRDHMTVIKTDAMAINYIMEKELTLGAATVAAEGTKPRTTIEFEDVTENMKVIAHGMVVTRQQILQLGALMDFCENRLRTGIRHVEDVQIVKGDGTGSNYRGLMNRVGVKTYNRHHTGDSKLDTLRRAQTQLRLDELQPDLYLLNPEDWEDIELQKGTDDHYVWAAVTTVQGPMLWKLPVFETTAIDAGDFLTGAFAYGAMIYDREEATVQVFEQHASLAETNQAYVRAEQFSMLVVPLPGAFLKGEFPQVEGSGS